MPLERPAGGRIAPASGRFLATTTANNRTRLGRNHVQCAGIRRAYARAMEFPMTTRKPKPPAGLSKATRKWWKALRDEYDIDEPAGLSLLESAACAWDRALQARAAIEAEGLSVKDRFGQT